MKKILCVAIIAAGAVFAGSAGAAPMSVPAPPGVQVHHDGGQIELARHGGRGMHRGWSKRHYGWRRGHHYGWRHARPHRRPHWR